MLFRSHVLSELVRSRSAEEAAFDSSVPFASLAEEGDERAVKLDHHGEVEHVESCGEDELVEPSRRERTRRTDDMAVRRLGRDGRRGT